MKGGFYETSCIYFTGARGGGPYSQAIRAGEWLFLSGQIPVDPATGEVAGTDVRTQARQVFEKYTGCFGGGRHYSAAVVKTTVFF